MTPPPLLSSSLRKLAERHCTRGAAKLSAAALARRLASLPGWSGDGAVISKRYRFADFHATIGFVNAIAWVANREDHHPDLVVSYDHCIVAWSTHDAGGVTENDVICAARTDRVFAG